jgi:superfamily II DNA or RNA helicase
MYLVIKNNYIILSTENEDLLYNIYCSLTFDDKSQAYSPYKGFDPKKIIKIRFARYVDDLDLPSLKIPIGFKYFIKAILEDYEYTEIDDRKKLNDIQEFKMDDIELWEHQKKIIEKALSHYRGIIKSPTGSGKTEAFLAILGSLKNSSLVIFNRKQLTHQSMKRAISRGIDAGIVQGDNVMEKHVTMATIQSIDKIEDITKYKNLILDECHNASSFNYQKILKMDHWLRIYGFSATPIHPEKFTLKSAKIVSNIGNIIANIESKPLIEKKILAKPKIFFITIFPPDDIFDKT